METIIKATRYHDFSCGHRVVGHESKCAFLHGHNYRVHFTLEVKNQLDSIGRVLDFSVIKEKLCNWLEANWDHRFLAWEQDGLMKGVVDGTHQRETMITREDRDLFIQSIVWTDFNPTAENMAAYLLEEIGPKMLLGTGARLKAVTVEETRKCSASATF